MVLVNIALLIGPILSILNSKNDENSSYKSHMYYTYDYAPFLKDATKIKEIQFKEYRFEFQEDKLPDSPISKIGVITKNDSIVLFEFIVNKNENDIRSYFYAMNNKTKKLYNYSIKKSKYKQDSVKLKYYTHEDASAVLEKIPKSETNSSIYKISQHAESLALTIDVESQDTANTIDSIKSRSPTKLLNNDNTSPKAGVFPEERRDTPKSRGPQKVEQEDELIKPKLYPSDGEDLTNLKHSFYINLEDRSLLKYPNRIIQMEYNNKVLIFDDVTKLPIYSITSFTVYLCKHNEPLLIQVMGTPKFTLYSPDENTGKWINYIVESLREHQMVDENGIVHYKYDIGNKLKMINAQISEECSELCKKICTKYEEGAKTSEDTSPDVTIKIGLVQTDLNFYESVEKENRFVINPKDCYLAERPQGYMYHYYFNENQTILKYPNRLEQITFNDKVLVFDNHSVLPRAFTSSFEIIACIHNEPFLIRIIGLNGCIYYYKAKAKKWANHTVDFLKAHERIYQKGAACYEFHTIEGYRKNYENIFENFASLYTRECQLHENKSNPQLKNPNVEMTITLREGKDSSRTSPTPSENDDSGGYPEERSDLGEEFIPIKSEDDSLDKDGGGYPEEQEVSPKSEDEGVVIIKSSGRFVDTEKQSIIMYACYIDREYRQALKYPNKIISIKFNDDILDFDENAKMTALNTLSLKVVTCNHGVPIMVWLNGPYGYIFYTLDTNTGKWTNHEVSSLLVFKKTCENGVVYYDCDDSEQHQKLALKFYENRHKECISLLDKFCGKDQCRPVIQVYNSNFEINVKIV